MDHGSDISITDQLIPTSRRIKYHNISLGRFGICLYERGESLSGRFDDVLSKRYTVEKVHHYFKEDKNEILYKSLKYEEALRYYKSLLKIYTGKDLGDR